MSDALKSLSIDALERVDAVCRDFESRWKTGHQPCLDEFLLDIAGAERLALIEELILLDVEYKRRHGDRPDIAEYLADFPDIDRSLLDRAVDGAPPPMTVESSAMPSRHAEIRDLVPGAVIGSYRVQRVLGRGGMGTVYAAEHQHLKRTVALKLQDRVCADDEAQLLRFRREAEIVAHLTHPHIVTAYDAGEYDDRLYLVTELIDGADLAREVQEHGPLPLDDALRCVRDAALGLAYAHEKGVIHRDVKPSNLLRDRSGTIKVSDLGLASFRTGSQSAPTGMSQQSLSEMTVGTIDYMPPEQAFDSSLADVRSDVYSLGCTLYFLLTGRPIFAGETPLDRVIAHASAELPDLKATRPDAPLFVADLLCRMVAKSPEERIASMAEVVAMIDDGLRQRTHQDATVPTASLSMRAVTRQRRTPSHWALAVCLMLAATATVTAVMINVVDPDMKPSPTTSEAKPSERSQGRRLSLPVVPFDNAADLQRQWSEQLSIPQRITLHEHEFVLIPPGVFLMSSSEEQLDTLKRMGAPVDTRSQREEPQHEVTIASPFYLSVTEVTVDQFARFVQAAHYTTTIEQDRERPPTHRPASLGYGRVDGRWEQAATFDWQHIGELELSGDMPVMNVSHDDASAYVEWLSGHESEFLFRLPRQSQWEFAARAGTATSWYYGETFSVNGNHCWHRRNSDSRPHAVATLEPNPFGLFDIYGNVDEWCEDRLRIEGDTLIALNPGQPASPSSYTMVAARGGDFRDDFGNRSTARCYTGRHTVSLRGFRLLAEFKPRTDL